MKQVHLISWAEYQDVLGRIRRGEKDLNLPSPDLFECGICGTSVKYKREHLNKKHGISEDVYETLIEKKDNGEDISADLPARTVHKCVICDRECIDLKKHIEKSHQITEDEYNEICENSPNSPLSHKTKIPRDFESPNVGNASLNSTDLR